MRSGSKSASDYIRDREYLFAGEGGMAGWGEGENRLSKPVFLNLCETAAR